MEAIRAFLHTIWWRRVDLYSYTSHFDSSGHLYDNSNATMPIHSFVAHHSSSIYMCAKRKLHRSISWRRSGPSYTPYGCGESTSIYIPPTSTSQDTSMAIATQPCLSILS